MLTILASQSFDPKLIWNDESRMTGEEIPQGKRIERRRLFRLVWIVPVMRSRSPRALVFHRMQDYGPEITVTFTDGGGLRVGQTPVRYRGVQVGEVTGVTLSKDEKNAVVRIRLTKSGEGIAREGSEFWIVRPRVGFGQVTGLPPCSRGPRSPSCRASRGRRRNSSSAGLETPPVALEGGLRIIVRAERPKMRVDAPVYYRGVEVGVVQKIDLAPNALSADVHVVIYPRYVGAGARGLVVLGRERLNVNGGMLKGSRSSSSRCAPSSPAASSSPRRRAPRARSRAPSSSCTTSRRRNGSPGRRRSPSRRKR